ncbi:GlcG/HbpS family heme-binding protein [Nocardia colli]|uniref:GlcG/HbpS family heme-binding protein n=1 Tax=Nocardia colli TaxID=2545717 RepID=UPI0035D5D137
MTTPFTDNDAAALVDRTATIARTIATDDRGPQPVAICCMVAAPDVLAVPTALRRMDGAKAVSVIFATNKAFTVLAYKADTKKHSDRLKSGLWSEADMTLLQSSVPQFSPWDGGIMVMDSRGELLCSLAVAGRTSEGDRRAAVLAAHALGYKTNFDESGEPL